MHEFISSTVCVCSVCHTTLIHIHIHCLPVSLLISVRSDDSVCYKVSDLDTHTQSVSEAHEAAWVVCVQWVSAHDLSVSLLISVRSDDSVCYKVSDLDTQSVSEAHEAAWVVCVSSESQHMICLLVCWYLLDLMILYVIKCQIWTHTEC